MKTRQGFSSWIDTLRRAFVEFLTFPTLIILGFLALAVLSYSLDKADIASLAPARNFLKSHVFANAKATSDLLGAIAAGIISVTSITITLLLIVVQQSAASMTSQVFDQFLLRKTNQFYFGFFVGLALYSLITLATVNEPFNPVWGATLAFLLTVVALSLLVLLLYTTVNQMRPIEIIEAIRRHILRARERQLPLLQKTRRESCFEGTISRQVRSQKSGYVSGLSLETLAKALQENKGEAEIELTVSLGTFVAFEDVLAIVKTTDETALETLCSSVVRAVHFDLQRDIDADAAYGIMQLETIAWTSISTSKSNPAPGLLTIHSLRDVLARWSHEEAEDKGEKLPVVYVDDVMEKLLNAFETLAVVSSESMQHQNYIAVLQTFTVLFDRLPHQWQERAEDMILRILSVAGDHAPTLTLDQAFEALAEKLRVVGKIKTAVAVETARQQLLQSVGKLNSRATRVPGK